LITIQITLYVHAMLELTTLLTKPGQILLSVMLCWLVPIQFGFSAIFAKSLHSILKIPSSLCLLYQFPRNITFYTSTKHIFKFHIWHFFMVQLFFILCKICNAHKVSQRSVIVFVIT